MKKILAVLVVLLAIPASATLHAQVFDATSDVGGTISFGPYNWERHCDYIHIKLVVAGANSGNVRAFYVRKDGSEVEIQSFSGLTPGEYQGGSIGSVDYETGFTDNGVGGLYLSPLRYEAPAGVGGTTRITVTCVTGVK